MNETIESGSDRHASGPDFLAIGQIIKPHGIRGELSVKVLTNFPERFDSMESVFIGDEKSERQYVVTSTRPHKGGILLTLPTVTDRTAAEEFRGLYLKIPTAEAVALPAGQYYQYQLEGLDVVTDDGEALGKIAYVLETGANDVYVIQGPKGEVLLPAIDDVILSVDLEANQMVVHILEGLL